MLTDHSNFKNPSLDILTVQIKVIYRGVNTDLKHHDLQPIYNDINLLFTKRFFQILYQNLKYTFSAFKKELSYNISMLMLSFFLNEKKSYLISIGLKEDSSTSGL